MKAVSAAVLLFCCEDVQLVIRRRDSHETARCVVEASLELPRQPPKTSLC